MAKGLSPHIGLFGRRNAGKSSLINVIAGQSVAIVSETPGTTTDAVKKSIEVPPLGPVVFVDTAGIDDQGSLGESRVLASYEALKQVDLALLVTSEEQWGEEDAALVKELERLHTPFIIVHNKEDQLSASSTWLEGKRRQLRTEVVPFCAKNPTDLTGLIETIAKHLPNSAYNNPSILGDLLKYGDVVLLVTPIDIEAPKGRLILPQVQTIRDALDNDCMVVMVKERELDMFFRLYGNTMRPKLAVTDSQVFLKADASIPKDVPLTSFSILFARLKGDFRLFTEGARCIGKLKDGDRILMLESCSHHSSADDIGKVKIPRWLNNYTGKKLEFDMASGLNAPPRPIKEYKLVVQCGGCMLTRKQVLNRIQLAVDAGVPVTNYGMAIAFCHGILERAISPFAQSLG